MATMGACSPGSYKAPEAPIKSVYVSQRSNSLNHMGQASQARLNLLSTTLLNSWNFLCVLYTNLVSDALCKYFLQFCSCLFTLLIVSFVIQKLISLTSYNLSNFINCLFCTKPKTLCLACCL